MLSQHQLYPYGWNASSTEACWSCAQFQQRSHHPGLSHVHHMWWSRVWTNTCQDTCTDKARLTLTSACRAYIMEPQWNPALEEQALDRIHRIGQTQPVTTVRFVMEKSIEQVGMTRSCYDLLTKARMLFRFKFGNVNSLTWLWVLDLWSKQTSLGDVFRYATASIFISLTLLS